MTAPGDIDRRCPLCTWAGSREATDGKHLCPECGHATVVFDIAIE